MKTRGTSSIGSLIARKRRNVEEAEKAHAAAHAMTRAAERVRIDADRRWLAALDAAEHIGIDFDLDLESRASAIDALRRAVDQAEQQYAVARVLESESRQTMTDARTELRRFELWVAAGEREQSAHVGVVSAGLAEAPRRHGSSTRPSR